MIEPMVFLPGMLCDIRVFMPQIVALSRELAVVTVPTGNGERVDEIASQILSMVPNKFAMMGHGFGGVVAMEIMRRAPERVTRVALISTTPLPETPQEAADREMRIVAAKAGRLDDVIAQEIPPSTLAPANRKEVMSKIAAMARAGGVDTYVRQSRAMQRRRDQQSTLRRVQQPALVMCGDHDTVTPLKRHEFMSELIPYAKLSVIQDAGHMPSLEQPVTLTDSLKGWMRQPLVLR